MPTIDTVERVGSVIRESRRAQKLTQAQLATKAHVSRQFVIELESGHARAELGKVLGVLRALDVKPRADRGATALATTTATAAAVSSAAQPYAPPYVIPDDLSQLRGPTSGQITLPNRLLWNPSRPFDLSEERRHRSMLRTVLREARSIDDLAAFVDAASLIELWPTLGLPENIADAWEERFPVLRRPQAARERTDGEPSVRPARLGHHQ